MKLSTTTIVFLDANVVMYAAGSEHLYRTPSQNILQAVARGELTAAIDVEIIQEILHRYGAQQRFTEAITVANDLLTLVSFIYPITLSDVQRAMTLFQQHAMQGVKARDALHAAVMLNNNLTYIVSADRHFDLIPGIQRIDPLNYSP